MRRMVVVGSSGAGKTTLAQELADRLGVPHVELDALHWGPNWTATPTEIFRPRVEAAIAGDGVDGQRELFDDARFDLAASGYADLAGLSDAAGDVAGCAANGGAVYYQRTVVGGQCRIMAVMIFPIRNRLLSGPGRHGGNRGGIIRSFFGCRRMGGSEISFYVAEADARIG